MTVKEIDLGIAQIYTSFSPDYEVDFVVSAFCMYGCVPR
jgi:hypothetical protein